MSDTVGLTELERAAELVHAVMPPTPQYRWPLLSGRAGCEVWVKHENQTPAGAFKIRGGIVYVDDLRRARPDVTGVIAATRGNHGQSVAFAATRAGSYKLRPSKIALSANWTKRLSKSAALKCCHSVHITNASAPINAASRVPTKRKSSRCP